MPLSKKYRGVPEPSLASADWYDIATGTGYKRFYCGDLQTGADSNTKVMGTEVYYSQNGYTTFANPAVIDLDFDLAMEVPITVYGDAIVQIPNGSDQNNAGHTMSGALFQVAGVNETQIGSTHIGSTSANNTEDVTTIRINIPKRTRIKAGNKLRFNINAGASPNTLTFFHDPKNRDLSASASIGGGWITSQMILDLPIML